jgi:aromatic ring-opening dioxygenase catalytic subunit (LigB family)
MVVGGRALAPLQEEGVLVLASLNMEHAVAVVDHVIHALRPVVHVLAMEN